MASKTPRRQTGRRVLEPVGRFFEVAFGVGRVPPRASFASGGRRLRCPSLRHRTGDRRNAVNRIALGAADVRPTTPGQPLPPPEQLQAALHAVGFELVDDPRDQLVEQIKALRK